MFVKEGPLMDKKTPSPAAHLIAEYQTRDPFQLARALGFSVKYIDTRKQKGFCKILLNNGFIFISQNMSPQMQKMTCAHELGHLLLHRDALTRRDYLMEMEIFDITDQRELEANQFAADLLIDEKELLEKMNEGYDVLQIASILDVNVNLLMVKYLNMNRAGNRFDLPYFPKSGFLGTIEDRADSV